ncbi:dienelactone hydrolase family protein [Flammeovirga aprica]|uniref:Dienelactone hydrolase family protein n=1 Tax=Flammeovirga aprica JL-4 TaxID=694437 RepID=A0A7X9RSJ1_9BACT|nr:dienelactone hydrolase family protein [Flammeovirga aprica]NME67290.1 dienelactone hydrolase family protein [Flammeovirga aprica JL-4]
MKNTTFITLLLLFSGLSALLALHNPSKPEKVVLCHADIEAVRKFALFTEEAEFRKAHAMTRELNTQKFSGKRISFDVAGGKKGEAYFVSSKKKSNKYLFVFHEWWGLNDYVRNESDRLSKELKDVNIIALDLYDGKVGTTREEASKYMKACDPERAASIVNGAMAYVGKDAKIATIGWCFGGGWSLQSALLLKQQAVGCVIYYGMPVQDVERLSELNCDVLGIFGEEDKWINPDVVAEFEGQMKEADKGLTVKMYKANHAFANPSSDRYMEADAQNANKEALMYLKKRFK